MRTFIIGIAAVACFTWSACLHAETQQLALPGLDGPVEILVDPWGIAHIYAKTEHDLFFAQGYNVARDRLFQLEIWRRQATGTLAELLGARAIAQDTGARLLKYRGDIATELSSYHPRGASIVSAFVDGINAYIERTEREPKLLPIEFRMLGIQPGRWSAEVVVSRHNGLFRNATSEVQLAQLVRVVGAERAGDLLNLRPGRPSLAANGIDLAAIQNSILSLYRASRATVSFRPEDVLPEFRGPAREDAPKVDDDANQGSNNWVVGPEHTFTRSAIMANDPHRVIQVPSLRYWVHLVGLGWNVLGAGEPALPGVAVGHNEAGAWGFTIFPADQEDVYVCETNYSDTNQYRYQGKWETMKVINETIAVKNHAPVTVALKFTRHGPVLHEDPKNLRAFALRAAWLEPGAAPYLASLRIDQAHRWETFRDACRYFYTPSENMVWADVNGHIGWQAVGLVPIRTHNNGLMPVPGDGRFAWDGYVPIHELPHVLDPERGWFASANQENLPRGYPHQVSYQWTDPFRFSRVEEVLGSGRRFTLADMMQLQQDELSLPARALVPLLRATGTSDKKLAPAIERLSSWDFVLDRESVAASLYVAWESNLKKAVWELQVPAEARRFLPVSSFSLEKTIALLNAPDGRFGTDPIAARDALLLKSLAQAIADLEKRLGPDMSTWRYGQERSKHSRLVHALSAAVKPEFQEKLNIGPLPRGGNGSTVNNTSDSLNQASGASFRIIADTGDWDRSVGTNAPGQSGDPESPHYRDLFGLWAGGQYFPAFFSRAKVESVSSLKIMLSPEAH